jgi:hypothetical protein
MDAPCDYDQQVVSNWQHTIEEVRNIDRKVFPYIDDTRKCIMKFDVTIGGVEHYTSGEYVFGPDVTENYACDQAMTKGKKDIIQQVSPEVLTAKTEMNCSLKQEQEPVIAQSDTLPTHTPVPQPEVQIVERVIVQQAPQPVIRFIPMTGNSGYIQTNPVDKAISSVVDLIIGSNRY